MLSIDIIDTSRMTTATIQISLTCQTGKVNILGSLSFAFPLITANAKV